MDAFQAGRVSPWHPCSQRCSALGRPLPSLREKETPSKAPLSDAGDADGAAAVSSFPARADQRCRYQHTSGPAARQHSTREGGPRLVQPACPKAKELLPRTSQPVFSATFHPCCFTACGTVPAMFATEQTSFKRTSCCRSAGTRCWKQQAPWVVSVTPFPAKSTFPPACTSLLATLE